MDELQEYIEKVTQNQEFILAGVINDGTRKNQMQNGWTIRTMNCIGEQRRTNRNLRNE